MKRNSESCSRFLSNSRGLRASSKVHRAKPLGSAQVQALRRFKIRCGAGRLGRRRSIRVTRVCLSSLGGIIPFALKCTVAGGDPLPPLRAREHAAPLRRLLPRYT